MAKKSSSKKSGKKAGRIRHRTPDGLNSVWLKNLVLPEYSRPSPVALKRYLAASVALAEVPDPVVVDCASGQVLSGARLVLAMRLAGARKADVLLTGKPGWPGRKPRRAAAAKRRRARVDDDADVSPPDDDEGMEAALQ